MHLRYNQLELNHVTGKFYDPVDWVFVHCGYPSPGEMCLVAYCSPKNDCATWYSVAEYTTDGFKEWNTDGIIPSHNVQAWKRLGELPY